MVAVVSVDFSQMCKFMSEFSVNIFNN